jgi:Tol biopolymer transport system component
LIDAEFAQRAPTLSPDGKWLAYQLNEKATGSQVFVSPFPNTATARWQISRNGGADPQWSRRGAELVYRDNNGMIVAVPVSTMPSFSVGKPQELFSTAPYIINSRLAVAPDGSRMLFFQRRGGANERLTFVENWTRELDRQTFAKR